jgi:transposase
MLFHQWNKKLLPRGHNIEPRTKREKTDAADAEAVCEAVTRPTMRFVPVESPEQQAALSMHRTRDLLVKQRTQLINMIRGLGHEAKPREAEQQHRAGMTTCCPFLRVRIQ